MKSSAVRRYASWVPVFLVASLGACDALIGIEDLRSDGGDDGDGQSCQVPTDCPTAGNACFLRACVGGKCQITEAPQGTPVASQEAGDCSIVVCGAGSEAASQPDDTDVFVDGNLCTQDVCSAGVGTNPALSAGSPCGGNGGGVCDGAGMCVECIMNADCGGGGLICKSNECVPASCNDSLLNNSETDVDCGGGECPRCEHGRGCGVSADCISQVCSGDPGSKTCQVPSCTDGVRNGSESDQDCGGTCPACEDGSACMAAGDCQSSVCACPSGMPNCQEPLCQIPTCSDGVQNGGEVAPDCQGNCQGTCDPGEPCDTADDCGSLVCAQNVCAAPSCMDGVKNGAELGVDCGGPMCPACG